MSTHPLWLRLRQGHLSAASVLAQLGVSGPPVPIREMAAHMGIPVHEVPEPGWNGALHVEESPPQVAIWLRREDPEVRKRFTLAHELGHLLLRHPGPVFRDTTFVGSVEEAKANGYAANLLMPLPWVQTYMSGYGWNLEYVASLFGVSNDAMRIRVEKLRGMR